ncbi:MAG TPA: hypothetical protein VM911_16045 [Pyrinomonadaceae bacterium]|jgi:hypothetical protein|nr:hypothetical protein [Pyrinomonadaceae bacterium]
MKRRDEQLKPALVFVYHAESGLFHGLADMAHKTFSPQTYQCNLCALTYSTLGMRKSWKQFLETLRLPVEFLHADQLKQQYGESAGTALPAIFMKRDGRLELWIDADSINACRTMDDLKRLITDRLEQASAESK